MKGITEYERLISIRIMQEDAENIYSLLKTEQDSDFWNGNNSLLCIICPVMSRVYRREFIN